MAASKAHQMTWCCIQAPEFPILHSQDLVHWVVQSAVFQQRPDWADGSFWAPEISYLNGRLYSLCRTAWAALTSGLNPTVSCLEWRK
jgi:hypothetical protein